ncbi:MAG: DUF2911 domain-containing protein [Bacteroidia bacterium]
MKTNKTTLLLVACFLFATTQTSNAQLKTPAPSPLQTFTQAFGLGEIKIEYSRPSVKGRVIFGDLVPYGTIWRTGANNATKITFDDDIKVNNTPVAAGTYALYTIPGQTEWDIMLYKDLELGGNTHEYKPENELMRFKIKPVKTNEKVETFTIAINDMTFTTCKIDLVWENTRVSVPVISDHDARVMKQIDNALSPDDKRPYFSAASYYYDNGKDLNKALEWASKAAELNPKAYWITHTKAKILMKMKDYPGAMRTAEASKATAIAEKDDHYVSLNDKLMVDIRNNMGSR